MRNSCGWLLIALFVVAGCGPDAASDAPRLVSISKGPVRVLVSAAGPIQPLRAVEVKSRASGEVLEIPYDAGAAVTQGTTVARIDPREEQEKVQLAEADRLSAGARLTQAESRLHLLEEQVALGLDRAKSVTNRTKAELSQAWKDRDRQKGLFDKGLVAKRLLEDASTRARTAKAASVTAAADLDLSKARTGEVAVAAQDVVLARAGVMRADVALARAQERLADTVLRAAIDGLVLERQVEVGQIIASGISNIGGGTTLMVLADTSRLFVKAAVDESDIGRLRTELPAEVVVDAFPEKKFRGEVSWIAPLGKAEADVTSFEVLVEVFPDEFGELRAGMTATCQFVVAEALEALWVPPSSLRRDGERYLLSLPKEGHIVAEVGLRSQGRVQVSGAGVHEGLEILLAGRKPPAEKNEGEGERKSDPLWFLKKKSKSGK